MGTNPWLEIMQHQPGEHLVQIPVFSRHCENLQRNTFRWKTAPSVLRRCGSENWCMPLTQRASAGIQTMFVLRQPSRLGPMKVVPGAVPARQRGCTTANRDNGMVAPRACKRAPAWGSSLCCVLQRKLEPLKMALDLNSKSTIDFFLFPPK